MSDQQTPYEPSSVPNVEVSVPPVPNDAEELKRKRKAESASLARAGKIKKKTERESELAALKAQALELKSLKEQKGSEKLQEPVREHSQKNDSENKHDDTDSDTDEPVSKKSKVIVASSESDAPSEPGLLSNIFSSENIIRNGSVLALTAGAFYMKHLWKKTSSLEIPKPEKPQQISKPQQPQQISRPPKDLLGRPTRTPLGTFFSNVK